MKMLLEINKKYVLNFNVDGHNLTYTGRIISIEDNFVSFTDKFGETIVYNLSCLSSAKAVSNA